MSSRSPHTRYIPIFPCSPYLDVARPPFQAKQRDAAWTMQGKAQNGWDTIEDGHRHPPQSHIHHGSPAWRNTECFLCTNIRLVAVIAVFLNLFLLFLYKASSHPSRRCLETRTSTSGSFRPAAAHPERLPQIPAICNESIGMSELFSALPRGHEHLHRCRHFPRAMK